MTGRPATVERCTVTSPCLAPFAPDLGRGATRTPGMPAGRRLSDTAALDPSSAGSELCVRPHRPPAEGAGQPVDPRAIDASKSRSGSAARVAGKGWGAIPGDAGVRIPVTCTPGRSLPQKKAPPLRGGTPPQTGTGTCRHRPIRSAAPAGLAGGRLLCRCYNDGTAAGWSSLVARRAHNPKVAGSNPAPATPRS